MSSQISTITTSEEIYPYILNRIKPRVTWTEDTIDNEFMNKKSSKKCCIYHKPRLFDETSSDESDYEQEKINKNKKKLNIQKNDDDNINKENIDKSCNHDH